MAHGNWAHRTLIRMSLLGRCQGQLIVNVFHFEATTATEATYVDDTLAQAGATALGVHWKANNQTEWMACHTVDYSLEGVRTQVIERPGNRNHALLATDNTTGLPVVGTGPGAAPADEMTSAAVVRWRSLLAGKSHRGRTYIGPLAENYIQGGVLQAIYLTPLNAWRTDFEALYMSPSNTYANAQLTIYSRPYDKFDYGYVKGSGAARTMHWPEDYDGNSSLVLSSAVDLVGRTQRRRELGVGA